MAHGQEMDDAGRGVESVDDPVIADAQPVAVAAGQPMMGEGREPQSQPASVLTFDTFQSRKDGTKKAERGKAETLKC